jgi:hypothetical protein
MGFLHHNKVVLLQGEIERCSGQRLSDDTLRHELDRLGYVWKRSRYVLDPDPQRQKKTNNGIVSHRAARGDSEGRAAAVANRWTRLPPERIPSPRPSSSRSEPGRSACPECWRMASSLPPRNCRCDLPGLLVRCDLDSPKRRTPPRRQPLLPQQTDPGQLTDNTGG